MTRAAYAPPGATVAVAAARARPSGATRAVRAAGALVGAVAAVLGGIGWLYLLRRAGALDSGPRLGDALPLQRLAGGAAQPLARMAAAWVPAGLAGGVLASLAGVRRRRWRSALMLVTTLVLLLVLGAMADAVTASEALRAHLAEQPHRAATWAAAALAAAGAVVSPGPSLPAGRLASARRPRQPAGPEGRRSPGDGSA